MHYFKSLRSREGARALWENEESLFKYLNKLRELMCVKINELEPVHCEFIPKELESGKLYISRRFETAVHLCACGCGGKTVTPIGKDGWLLTEKDGSITLRPSIGNWSGQNPYHAHYFITNNNIEWL